MSLTLKKLSFFLLIILVSNSAAAQWWGGCVDAAGSVVLDYSDNTVNDIAVATVQSGKPIIKYNPVVLASVSNSTKKFFYYHECGHHALGQIITNQMIPLVSEQAADCWAIRKLVINRIFSVDDVVNVGNELASAAPGDWMHLPGTQRQINLQACLNLSPKIAYPKLESSTNFCPIITSILEGGRNVASLYDMKNLFQGYSCNYEGANSRISCEKFSQDVDQRDSERLNLENTLGACVPNFKAWKSLQGKVWGMPSDPKYNLFVTSKYRDDDDERISFVVSWGK